MKPSIALKAAVELAKSINTTKACPLIVPIFVATISSIFPYVMNKQYNCLFISCFLILFGMFLMYSVVFGGIDPLELAISSVYDVTYTSRLFLLQGQMMFSKDDG